MPQDFNILVGSSDQAWIRPVQDASPYDDVWAQSDVPTQQPEGIERVMLADDKLFVVLAVVLLIWFGIIALILRTDRRLKRLEDAVENGIEEPTTL